MNNFGKKREIVGWRIVREGKNKKEPLGKGRQVNNNITTTKYFEL